MICKNDECEHQNEFYVNNCLLRADTAGCESFLKEPPLTSKIDDGAEVPCSDVLSAIRSYRSSIVVDDRGDGMELLDIVSIGMGAPDVGPGLKELESLAEHISSEIGR